MRSKRLGICETRSSLSIHGRLFIVLMLSVFVSSSHAQVCDYHWQPLANSQPPYLATHWTAAFIEFQNPCGGCELISAGPYGTPGNIPFRGPMAWNGSCWRILGDGVSGEVSAMHIFDDGSGPALFVGGRFRFAGSEEVNNIAKWDGRTWSALAGGMPGNEHPVGVYAMEVFDDGRGPALYAGGNFPSADGIEVNHIARWDGRRWEALDNGISFNTSIPSVWDMEVFDDGSGPSLYVSGNFTDASGSGARWIARWDGHAWSSLGFNAMGTIAVLKSFNDGNGPRLYIGLPRFPGVVGWDGQTLTPVPGVTSEHPGFWGMEAFDDGTGNGAELYVVGNFAVHGATSTVAKWNGERWVSLDKGLPGAGANAMCTTKDHLVVGLNTYGISNGFPYLLAWNVDGWATLPAYAVCPDLSDANGDGNFDLADLRAIVAAWGDCTDSPCCADLNGDGVVDVGDLLLVIHHWS